MTITIDFNRGPEAVILVVAGELDAVGAPGLATALDTALVDRPPRLVIDSARVTFCSAAGLTVLLDAAARAHRAGIVFELDPCSRAIVRVAELADLLTLLPITSRTALPPTAPRLSDPAGETPDRSNQ